MTGRMFLLRAGFIAVAVMGLVIASSGQVTGQESDHRSILEATLRGIAGDLPSGPVGLDPRILTSQYGATSGVREEGLVKALAASIRAEVPGPEEFQQCRDGLERSCIPWYPERVKTFLALSQPLIRADTAEVIVFQQRPGARQPALQSTLVRLQRSGDTWVVISKRLLWMT